MPQPDQTLAGAPCWIDVFTSDTDKAAAFYGDLFGWTAQSAGEEYGGYINFSKGDQMVAGCMRNDGQSGTPNAWSVYLSSADAKATVDAAVARGAEVIVPAMDVMALGTMAVLSDPGHAAIGLWQPGLHKGFGIVAEAGAPSWFELHTRDYAAAVAFYREVFGWDTHEMSDTAEFRYTTLGEGDSAAAGIMDASGFLPADMPAHWTVYFGVADADAALERVVALGGTMLEPAQDTPYGRVAAVADPTGAAFRIIQAP
jgi:predicted enzyme related to lactoylglutathione lyase